MRVTVAGTGYVGLVTGTCLADLGNEVLCMDQDADKITMLQAGRSPIYEPGLEELLARNAAAGRLRFTTDVHEAVAWGDVIFLCVGTPRGPKGGADLSAIKAVARGIAHAAEGLKVVVIKSTCPVGTNDMVTATMRARKPSRSSDFSVVSNPEFLREGSAVSDFMHPSRVVIGTTDKRARRLLATLYGPLVSESRPLIVTEPRTAELIKYASNAFLAIKISFINEIADYCEAVGADVRDVAHGMGLDPRIGHQFLEAGPGYGGSCFPKDVRALVKSASEAGVELRLPKAAEAVNAGRVRRVVEKLRDALGGNLDSRRIALWGLAFKTDTNDLREAASLGILAALETARSAVVGYDPVVTRADLCQFGADRLFLASTKEEAAAHADALVILSGYREFRDADWLAVRNGMRTPVVLDTRNVCDPAGMHAMGFSYVGVGHASRASATLPLAGAQHDGPGHTVELGDVPPAPSGFVVDLAESTPF